MKFLTKLIGSSCMVPVFIFGISAYERTRIKREPYDVFSPNLPEEFNGVKVVFLSDLHNARFGKENERLIRAIREEDPDYILVGGDMFVAKPGMTTDIASSLLIKLAKEFPVICANGNHEFRMKIYRYIYGAQYDDYVLRLREAGITYLENKTITLERNGASIYLSGLEIGRIYYQRGVVEPMDDSYLELLLGKKKAKNFHILLAHNPVYFPEYADWGADLVLSGHNHGGLIRIPHFGGLISPQLRIFPEYDAGYYEKSGSRMIISRGLGTHTFHIRVHNQPELSVIRLYRMSSSEGSEGADEKIEQME